MSYIDNILEYIGTPVYITFLVILHLMYFAVYLGYFEFNSQYTNNLTQVIEIYICIFLMLRYHPFRKHTFHIQDSQIIFGSAVFLLANLGISQYITNKAFTTFETGMKMQYHILKRE